MLDTHYNVCNVVTNPIPLIRVGFFCVYSDSYYIKSGRKKFKKTQNGRWLRDEAARMGNDNARAARFT